MKTKTNRPTNLIKSAWPLLLLLTAIVNAQIINIPDIYFKGRLINARPTNTVATDINGNYVKIDTNNDHEIQVSEAEAIYGLNISSVRFIEDLTGIENFVNIKSLDISSNMISNIDLSPFQNLISLSCGYNQFTGLDVNMLPQLKSLSCRHNQITNMDISGLLNLTDLDCYENQLTNLDLTGLPNLKSLICQSNPLTSLNLTGLVYLEYLICVATQLTGIDLSTQSSLIVMDCSFSRLINLDVSHSPNLITLECSSCDLTSLNVIGLAQLETLNCLDNALPALDLSGLTHLKTLNCSGNQLQTLDLSGLPELVTLACNQNILTSINLSGVSNLITLNCHHNNLSDINVDDAVNLESLHCQYNQLVTLDVNRLTHLIELYVYQNLPLTSLFMKNGVDEDTFFSDNPNLRYVCADESQMAELQQMITDAQLVNVTVSNSYCSFTPGGNYNTISGNIKYDINDNGCDASDLNYPYIRINITDNTVPGAVLTNTTGNYIFYTQGGSFDIAPAIENATWFTVSPSTVTIPFADNNNNLVHQDFCIAANGYHPDVEVVISPIAFARPGFNATYQITFRNKGNQTFSEGIVGLRYDDAVLDFVSASQPTFTQSFENLNWLYTNLLPFESRSIQVTLNVNSPTETPAVNNGDLLHFEVYTYPFEVDENLQDNTFEYVQTVVGSYDPNDIICLEGDVVAPSEIGNYLHYAINFENIGTFPAENIVVKTEVDAAKFDIGSLQLMSTNFPVDARITGNKVEFIFENIQLPIGGHGHILLKIKTQHTLVTGDEVANRANIFFDYNFPIDTGLANTVFQTLSNSVFEIDSSVAIYPNPATTEITVKANSNIKSIQLYDAQGRIILTSLTDSSEWKLNISSYSKGIYFLKITTEKGAQVQKLLKD
jgi:Leucine-rich repeat (LRR) protein